MSTPRRLAPMSSGTPMTRIPRVGSVCAPPVGTAAAVSTPAAFCTIECSLTLSSLPGDRARPIACVAFTARRRFGSTPRRTSALNPLPFSTGPVTKVICSRYSRHSDGPRSRSFLLRCRKHRRRWKVIWASYPATGANRENDYIHLWGNKVTAFTQCIDNINTDVSI